MIKYSHFTLENGLQVYVHEDPQSAEAAFNLTYNVGSKDESEEQTGFAHLFEHLMFGGSKNIPVFDEPLQRVGGQNNAFTSPDITNYYIKLPAENIETAFWLESDRMLSLSFDQNVLDVQKNVVVEEFKQRYLNQPYGDVWLKLRPLAYTTHSYKWATIGKEISHIENATMDHVKDFFYKHYIPNNAVLVVGGDVTTAKIKSLAEKWFGPIAAGKLPVKNIPVEPKQTKARELTVEADVPLNAFYKAYHMPAKYTEGFEEGNLLSDILGNGKSSYFYKSLVVEKKLFNSASAYITGSNHPGLFVVSGNLAEGVTFKQAEEGVDLELKKIRENGIEEEELNKVKMKAKASMAFGEISLLNRVMAIGFAANLGNVERVNEQIEYIEKVTAKGIKDFANTFLVEENSNKLYYKSKNIE